jgi:hypothetical protein
MMTAAAAVWPAVAALFATGWLQDSNQMAIN